MEMLLHAAGGLKMRHLPTTGGAPATTAVLGKHAALWASPPALAIPHIKAGKMRPLATWGATRLAAFPDVPTLKELGYDVEYYLWVGLFAPRGAPATVVKALRDATRQAVADPEFKSRDGQGPDADRLPGRRRVQGVVGPRRGHPGRRRQKDRAGRNEMTAPVESK